MIKIKIEGDRFIITIDRVDEDIVLIVTEMLGKMMLSRKVAYIGVEIVEGT